MISTGKKAGAHLHFVHTTNAQCLAAEMVGSDECEKKNGKTFWLEIQMGKGCVDRIATFDDWQGGQKGTMLQIERYKLGAELFSKRLFWWQLKYVGDCYLRQLVSLSKLQIQYSAVCPLGPDHVGLTCVIVYFENIVAAHRRVRLKNTPPVARQVFRNCGSWEG